jgi:uncharacterized membrane protein
MTMRSPSAETGTDAMDLTIARILTVGTYVSVTLLVVGVAIMAIDGRSPLDLTAAPFDPARIVGDILAARPEGALWLGLVILLATPAARVAASLLGYLRSGERQMVQVSLAILIVIAAGVAIGVILGTPTAG